MLLIGMSITMFFAGWIGSRVALYDEFATYRCYYTFFSDGKGKSYSQMIYLDESNNTLAKVEHAPGELDVHAPGDVALAKLRQPYQKRGQ